MTTEQKYTNEILEIIEPILAFDADPMLFMPAVAKVGDKIKEILAGQVEPVVKPACFDWQKERPTKPCVFMTRVWNKSLGIYDYNIWRFEKVDCDGGWYLGWLTEDGEEWDDIKDCNFDEYCIIESKSV